MAVHSGQLRNVINHCRRRIAGPMMVSLERIRTRRSMETFTPDDRRAYRSVTSPRSDGVRSGAGSDDLYVEVPDLFAQRVAIHTEEVGGPDLIAPGRRESCGQQRVLHLAKDSVIETGRGQIGVEAGEIAR